MRRRKQDLHRSTRFETFEEKLALSAQPIGDFLIEAHTGQLDHHYGDLAPVEALAPVADFNLNLGVTTPGTDKPGEVQTQLSEAHAATGVNDVFNTYGFDGAGQTVAVIDSGIAYDHDALGGGFGTSYRVVGGWDFAENDANPYDDGPAGFHGTHVAGIVGSDDAVHRGVASGADLVALRVFDDNGAGYFNWVEDALQWVHDNRNAFENPITTVNLSLGTSWNEDSIPSWAMLEDEFAQLEQDGIFIAVSAGNSFEDYNAPGLSYPAASPFVVPVASVDDTGLLSYFSQRNDRVLAAPGRSITSTVPDHVFGSDGNLNDFGTASGTSMAAPYTAGASMLVRQAMEFVGIQNITQDTIYDHFRATADIVYDAATSATYHSINVQAAIDALMPSDDYGSDAASAFDLGTVNGSTTLSGQFETATDYDFFTFTAGETGTIAFTIDTTATPVQAELVGGNATFEGNSLSFDVVANESYVVSFVNTQGTGAYDVAVTLVAEASTIASTVKTVEHDGLVYLLDSAGLLTVDGEQVRGETHDFSVTDSGALIALGTDGTLQRRTDQTWQTISQNVVKYDVHDSGAVYSLDTENWLSINGSRVWANTGDFSLDQGMLYWQSGSGMLQRLSGQGWKTIGRDVVKFSVQENNMVYTLHNDQWLCINGSKVWRNTQDFAHHGDTFYWLSGTGVLQSRFAGTWETIERDVVQFETEPGGGISYQTSAGQTNSVPGRSLVGNSLAEAQPILASLATSVEAGTSVQESTGVFLNSRADFFAAAAGAANDQSLPAMLANENVDPLRRATGPTERIARSAVAATGLHVLTEVVQESRAARGTLEDLGLAISPGDELEIVDSVFDDFASWS